MFKAIGVCSLVFVLSACQMPLQSHSPPISSSNPQSILEEHIEGFLIQKLNNSPFGKYAKPPKKSDKKPKQPWYNKMRHGDWRRSPELVLQDVLLTESGESIYGSEALASIQPDFAGKEIQLTLKGSFKDHWKALPLKQFLFTLDPELLQQSFIGMKPQARVLLNHSILLRVDSVSDTEIQATLDTTGVVELYLKGLHTISVEYGNYYSDGLIQVGEPEPVDDLTPQIDSVEVMRDKHDKPLHIRLTGDNFPTYVKMYYTLIDGEFGFGYQTEVLRDGGMETVVHIPDPDTFDQKDSHSVAFATPFGVAFREF